MPHCHIPSGAESVTDERSDASSDGSDATCVQQALQARNLTVQVRDQTSRATGQMPVQACRASNPGAEGSRGGGEAVTTL